LFTTLPTFRCRAATTECFRADHFQAAVSEEVVVAAVSKSPDFVMLPLPQFPNLILIFGSLSRTFQAILFVADERNFTLLESWAYKKRPS
jgi:hypothetical protein